MIGYRVFDLGNECWDGNPLGLGSNQILMFKKFLRECGLIDKKNKTTSLFDIVQKKDGQIIRLGD